MKYDRKDYPWVPWAQAKNVPHEYFAQAERNSFTYHLLQMDARIKLFSYVDDETEKDIIAFRVNKTEIQIACFLPALSHEIAHWVEMSNPKRWLVDNWGFWSFNLSGEKDNPEIAKQFFAGLSREIRVRVIQDIIASNAILIQDQRFWYNQAVTYLPFGKFQNSAQLDEWISHLEETTLNKWNKDRIETEWIKRLNAAREYMDTDLIAA